MTTNDKVEAIAENVWIRVMARIGMILSPLALPVIAYIWTTALGGIERTVGATLHEVKMLAESERKNSDRIIELQGHIRLGEQRDTEQDRRISANESALARTRLPSFPPESRE